MFESCVLTLWANQCFAVHGYGFVERYLCESPRMNDGVIAAEDIEKMRGGARMMAEMARHSLRGSLLRKAYLDEEFRLWTAIRRAEDAIRERAPQDQKLGDHR